ncbi:hypothetical protein B0T14DRAFT_521837 [Immersiella caudata]|uniref:Uncharacterized protein n=1 Tax=Immersiella caudata TaxID=314043 RepID=A0AA39WSP3_9PEZI|nr:hypothetical protein B0T14DRAFT_521837 [Immersiella caudata]
MAASRTGTLDHELSLFLTWTFTTATASSNSRTEHRSGTSSDSQSTGLPDSAAAKRREGSLSRGAQNGVVKSSGTSFAVKRRHHTPPYFLRELLTVVPNAMTGSSPVHLIVDMVAYLRFWLASLEDPSA